MFSLIALIRLLFSREAKSSWKIHTSEIRYLLAQSSKESRHSDQAQRNGPFLHPVEDSRTREALRLELVTHWGDFYAQNPAESPRQSLLLRNKPEHHEASPTPPSCLTQTRAGDWIEGSPNIRIICFGEEIWISPSLFFESIVDIQ